MTTLLILAGIAVFVSYAVAYVSFVALGQLTLLRARRTPGGEPAKGYTFVGRPLGDRYYDPWRAEKYFENEEFMTLQDAALVRRARLVKRLMRIKNALLPALLVSGVVLLVISRFDA